MFSSSRYFLTALESDFSIMLKIGLNPLFVKYVIFPLNVAIVDASFESFTFFARI